MRLLVTGAHGFTGRYLIPACATAGFDPHALVADLRDKRAVAHEVAQYAPTHVVHLAAISAVTHENASEIYDVNVVGSVNLLDALAMLAKPVDRVLLVSSGNVYGNSRKSPISERDAPDPLNHYACSKLAMEFASRMYAARFPVVVARTFNYTGPGHDDRFLIPKLIACFVALQPTIELGNLDVEREFNDVRFVVQAYLALLLHGSAGEIYNVCTGVGYSVRSVLHKLFDMTGHAPILTLNPALVRSNEVFQLTGDGTKLRSLAPDLPVGDLQGLLAWMLGESTQKNAQ